MAIPPNERGVRGGYTEIETLDDPGGAHAVITKRNQHNTFSVALFRKYQRDGQTERTSFFGLEHMDSLKRMVGTVEKRLHELEEQQQSANRR